ncbi:unnamed protein product, partial [Discosporangium mesarthrocarpum]
MSCGATNPNRSLDDLSAEHPGRSGARAVLLGVMPESTGLVLGGGKRTNMTSSREERKKKQVIYREQLERQIVEGREQKRIAEERLRELEEQEERKAATYNPWGQPGAGAPLRHTNGELVTNVRAYHRAKQQGLIPQDLSPNQIRGCEDPYGFP